jgi:hypothetical protein
VIPRGALKQTQDATRPARALDQGLRISRAEHLWTAALKERSATCLPLGLDRIVTFPRDRDPKALAGVVCPRVRVYRLADSCQISLGQNNLSDQPTATVSDFSLKRAWLSIYQFPARSKEGDTRRGASRQRAARNVAVV